MIKIIDLKKKFDGRWITKGVNLDIPDNKMTVVIGRSGEGKSVLLKQIIGLLHPDEGQVIVDGVDITKLTERELNQQFKKFGYVFQFAALLDSLNVFENVAIELLEEEGMTPEQALPIVKEKLAMVNLPVEDTLYKYPSELSGGMRKRVGLARTLVTNPKIILYDEPTTGLDPITTKVIHDLMYDMQHRLNVTSVVISHDIEIFKYADYVALLYDGQIKYFGDAKTIWESDNPYVYQFIRGLTEGPIPIELAHKSEDSGG
ncbi:MAG TPA: ATP-binding cassette domain-containing protein [Candidatus Babeliales bacterium]|nr:ATP-binding cassette domain-containing protein [Candidatus Babeliales bacterium]